MPLTLNDFEPFFKFTEGPVVFTPNETITADKSFFGMVLSSLEMLPFTSKMPRL